MNVFNILNMVDYFPIFISLVSISNPHRISLLADVQYYTFRVIYT